MTLTQRLVRDQNPLPKKIILISPVLDASMKNPDINSIEPFDPMLGIKGVLSAKQMAADQLALNDPAISPIYGKFNDFPETILFAGEYDITYPDQIRLEQILKDEKINHRLILGEKMPHIWPLLPVMYESQMALNEIIGILRD